MALVSEEVAANKLALHDIAVQVGRGVGRQACAAVWGTTAVLLLYDCCATAAAGGPIETEFVDGGVTACEGPAVSAKIIV